jgi:23S rRNA pseudouridine1911/1915/1917 synthase
VRLDAWLAGQLARISRARVQSSIRQGLILVNGEPVNKVSYMVKEGDQVDCQLSLQQPMDAKPENIPLDIEYEDKHLLVINKPAHMVHV